MVYCGFDENVAERPPAQAGARGFQIERAARRGADERYSGFIEGQIFGVVFRHRSKGCDGSGGMFGSNRPNVMLPDVGGSHTLGYRLSGPAQQGRNRVEQLVVGNGTKQELRTLAPGFGFEHGIGDAAGDEGGHLGMFGAPPEDEVQAVIRPQAQICNQEVRVLGNEHGPCVLEIARRTDLITRCFEQQNRAGPIASIAVHDQNQLLSCHS